MSRFRGQLNRDRTVDVLLVCAIIVSASIIIVPYILPRPLPEPPVVTLHILTQDSVMIQTAIEEWFLNSTLAQQHNIVDIEWTSLPSSMWNDRIGSGSFDLVMGSIDQISQFSNRGLLRRINQSGILGVNETIAGVNMRGYNGAQQTIWNCYGFYVTIFELLVNETLLQENGLPVPSTVDDLLSPQYHLEEDSSLIGMTSQDIFREDTNFNI